MWSAVGVFFDDFAYVDAADPLLASRGWTIRSDAGGPGVPGATWSAVAVTFPTVAGRSVLQLESSTDGTPSGTVHAEVRQRRKFYEGTYAARVRFSDAPASGPGGDRLVQAFFTISPLAFDMDPNYSELDVEYLPNGGLGEQPKTLLATSWETYREHPGLAVNTQTRAEGGFAGWHDLTVQVLDRRIRYFVDGGIFAEHGEPYYPEVLMSINASQWFTHDGLVAGRVHRTYRMWLDYVLFSQGVALPPDEVTAQVARYRAAGIDHVDTVMVDRDGGDH